MNEPQVFEVKTHPAGAAKKADPITPVKVIATGRSLDLVRYPALRDGGESGLAG
jgi:hypothetical protein